MHELLLAAYGEQHWWPAETSFEVILGAYLTQNTAWKAVERSLANLRAAGVFSLEALRAVRLEELTELIAPSGFARRKAPSLKAFVALLDGAYGGSLERMAAEEDEALRAELLALPGVGPETADAILLYALCHTRPMADEYLRRIAVRHGMARGDYEELTALVREAFACDPETERRQLYNEFHALTVAVGKAHCSRRPRCEGCPLNTEVCGRPRIEPEARDEKKKKGFHSRRNTDWRRAS